MAWKAIKDHYRIKHNVQIEKGVICIGSGYIHDLITICCSTGEVLKSYRDRNANTDLARYQAEFDADPEKLRQLVMQQDTFQASITVYTYEGANILAKLCEIPGWPNATHDGVMMYENSYSTDKQQVVSWAKSSAASGVSHGRSHIEELEQRLVEAKAYLARKEADLATLNEQYPNAADAHA